MNPVYSKRYEDEGLSFFVDGGHYLKPVGIWGNMMYLSVIEMVIMREGMEL